MWNPLDPDRRAVKRGARLLDRHELYWFADVDLDRLNLDSGDRCVLGQVFDDYFTGLRELGLDYRQVWSHGFIDGATRGRRKKLWRREVEDRRRQVRSPR